MKIIRGKNKVQNTESKSFNMVCGISDTAPKNNEEKVSKETIKRLKNK